MKIVERVAEKIGLLVQVEYLTSCKDAQNCVHPYGTYCILLDGEVLTYRFVSEKEFTRILSKKRN